MRWYHYVAYFFGGAFLANTLPHLAAAHRLQRSEVPAPQLERYMQNLNGRVAHIGMINKKDQARIKRLLPVR